MKLFDVVSVLTLSLSLCRFELLETNGQTDLSELTPRSKMTEYDFDIYYKETTMKQKTKLIN